MVMGRNECGSNAMVTVQMTVEEYLEMKSRQETKEVTTKQKNLVYGLEGIKTLFGCSTTTAWRIKNSEWIRPAISQVGRKIVVDADLALELANESTQRVTYVQPLRGGLMPINERKHSDVLCFLVPGRRIELGTS